MKTFTIVCFLLCIVSGNELSGQSFVVVKTDATSYPTVVSRAYAFAFSWAPEPIANGTITLKNDGADLPITVSQEPSTAGRSLSLMVLADVSASVAGGSPTTFDIIKGAAQQAPSILNQTVDEIGLGMFDANVTLLQGLTSDKTAFISSLPFLKVGSGSDLNKGLNSQPMGGLVHLQNAQYSRALLLFVDGAPSFNLNYSLQIAKAFRTKVYIIGVRTNLSPELKELADTTGGLWVENISTQNDANAYALAFVSDAKGLAASLLEFTPSDMCSRIHSAVFTRGSVSRTTSYSVPSLTISTLEWSQPGLDFGSKGTGGEITVRLTARSKPITIQSTVIDDPVFTLKNPIIPGTLLQPNESIDVTVRFAGAATSRFSKLSITSDGCEVQPLYMRGGLSTAGATLKLLRPNGGETFVAGIDTLIEWTNTLPTDPIRLEMSADGGSTWTPIVENATGNSYAWSPGPATGNNALIRAQLTIVDSSSVLVLRGHINPVYAAAFNRSGQRVVTGGHDGTVRVWNSSTGQEERQLGTHQGWVWGVATHPVLNIAASASLDGTVRVWDIVSGERIVTIKADGRVWSVDFSPNGKHLAIGAEKSLTIINTSDWSMTNLIAVPGGPVFACRYSTNGEILVTGENDKVVIRDAQTWEVRRTLSGHVGPVYAVAPTPDAQAIFSGGADLIVHKWNAGSGTETGRTTPAVAAILALDVSANGSRLLVGGGDATAKLYNVDNLALLNSMAGHSGLVYGSRFNSDASRVVTASTDETARIWDVSGLTLTEDISDAPFNIIGGIANVSDIQHGDVAVGFGNEKSTIIITNSSSDPLIVKSVRITSGDVNDFTLVTPFKERTLGASENITLETAFSPSAFGNRAVNLQVETGTGTKAVAITGKGISPKIIMPSVIDFGRQLANSATIDTVIRMQASAGSAAIEVTRTLLFGEQSGDFSIVSGGGTFTVSPTTPHDISLRFTPSEFGRFAGWIEFTLGDGSSMLLRLYGEGVGDARISSSIQSILYSTDKCYSAPVDDSVTFTNTGTSTLQVYAASIGGANANEFEIIRPTEFPFSMNPQEKKIFAVRFTPTIAGTKDAQLVVSSNAVDAPGGTSTIPLVARKDTVSFELSRSSVQFENVNEGQSVEQSIQIINTGSASLKWEQTPIDLGDFRIESIEPPITLPNGQSEVIIKFKGGVIANNYSASYNFVDSICQRAARLDINATVKSYIGLTLEADTVVGSIGSSVSVPIRVVDKVNFDRTSVTEIFARIRVNGTILTPTGAGSTGTFNNDGSRLYEVTIPIPQSGDIASNLTFNVTWGNDTASVIEFDSVWTNDTLLLRTQSGMVKIDNLCRQGGPRLLIRRSQSAAAIRVVPQPATDNAIIELSILEAGQSTVEMFDISGRLVQSVVSRKLSPGTYFIPLDLTALEAGSYTLSLTTPTQHISQRMSVVR